MLARSILLPVLLAIPLTLANSGSSTVRGSVVGPDAAVDGAVVTLPGTDMSVRSDYRGDFFLPSLEAGSHAVRVVAIGYTPIDTVLVLVDGEDQNVVFNMSRISFAID